MLHHTTKDYPESSQDAINNGLDVIFQTDYSHHKLFDPHFYDGGIAQERINDAVARVLSAKFELGLFDNPYVDEKEAAKAYPHKPIAKQAALEAMVLLKNDNRTLPLSAKKIAVLGADAAEARLGGYSGPGVRKISIADGLKEKLGNNAITFAPGPGRAEHAWEVLPAAQLGHYEGNSLKKGLQVSIYDNINLQGSAIQTGIDDKIDQYWTFMRPSEKLQQDFYSIKWEGVFTADSTGAYKIGLSGNDGYRLYLDNQLLIDNWTKKSFSTQLVSHPFEKGKNYQLKVEFFEPVSNGKIQLIWEKQDQREAQLRAAISTARNADAVVVVAGIEEGEFRDRAMLTLPGMQEQLIQSVAALGKPVTVVLIGGSAITMNSWKDKVNSILMAWYPGEEGGRAVAEVLTGAYNPGGKLPVTFPVHEAQLPLAYNHLPTGRGDDYNNLSGRPLFPFGFGLSYTSFAYSNLQLAKTTIGQGESVTLRFELKNTGKVAGEEVPQLYIRDNLASLAQPVMALKGFQRVKLAPGETRTISFTITPELLRMLNKDMQWVVEPGAFTIMIGASAADVRLSELLTVK
ncbi:glycoside hydrolase family 3 C-terminal domain-containing protein [Chitinophaga sedimenti]|uniref:glycoside hydrolase family 3 C-terminal domain-containing protein n=1 Tax=Chitinophaga sedimenti TaxID=2033606 RepID=UPI00200346F0|nr:glycoside hydrolase family 3 C-terminal domain-containing protein [Chitinophaga sedimenti]MCK7554126.1 glycoside hydrolase family 3 C-terminal domain-containing protein [Chitinophaga sedimenti]